MEIPQSITIGSVSIASPLILAPMSGVTDLPFRLIIREFHNGLVHTEFISSEGVFREQVRTLEYAYFLESERPISIQIFGSDPDIMAASALYIERKFQPDLIDLNFGCPVKKVVKKGAGAALLKNPDRIALICERVCSVVKTPVTIKIRAGWDQKSINFLEVGKIAENTGIQAITLHARFATQKYAGKAQWEYIKALKENINIPVIGNGDVVDPFTAREMFQQTGCDAIMIGRAALGNPWIFSSIEEYLFRQRIPSSPGVHERLETARRHLSLAIKFKGEKLASLTMKKHLLWYIKGFPEASRWRQEISLARSTERLFQILNQIAVENLPN